jgi:hypothetical protein
MLVISALWEAAGRKIKVQASLGKNLRPYSKSN